MHEWGDEWFKEHGHTFSKAMNLFAKINRVLRGPFFIEKEKYGTMRLEYMYYNTCLDTWLLRRNVLIIRNWPLHKVCRFIDNVFRICYITRLIWGYQRFVFNLATFIVVKKYPEVKVEIMDEYEFNDLLYGWVKKQTGYICTWIRMKS
jgi:hypothetical protein